MMFDQNEKKIRKIKSDSYSRKYIRTKLSQYCLHEDTNDEFFDIFEEELSYKETKVKIKSNSNR